MAEDGGKKRYRFILGDEPCDICVGLEGEYDSPPEVPVHPNCDCRIEEIEEDPDSDCHFDIREVQVSEETYTESIELGYEHCGVDEDGQYSLEVDLQGMGSESFDHGVKEAAEAAGWSPPSGALPTVDITVPANTEGSITLEAEFVNAVFTAECWKVCSKEDPAGGIKTTETYVGPVGGIFIGQTDKAQGSVSDSRPCGDEPPPQNTDDYYDPDDEVPA